MRATPLTFGLILAGGVLLRVGLPEVSKAMQSEAAAAPAAGGAGGAGGGAAGAGDGKGIFPAGTQFGRVDQGIDGSMPVGAKIRAPATVQLVGVLDNWYAGQPYAWWKILDGPDAGKYFYAAEQLHPIVGVGTISHAGDAIAQFAGSGTGFEFGFAAGDGRTLAMATTGYVEGQVTKAGQDVKRWLGV